MSLANEGLGAKARKLFSLSAYFFSRYWDLLARPERARTFFTNAYILKLLPHDFHLGQKLSRLEELEEEHRQQKAIPWAETKIILTLSSVDDPTDQFPLKIDILDIPVAKRWIGELKSTLRLGDPQQLQLNHLEKNFCFMGFPQSKRDVAFLCKELNYYIGIVNKKVRKENWRPEYLIDLHFTPEKVMEQDTQGRELLNKIHHYFEILSGPVWRRSDFFQHADQKTHFALRQINNLCHEMEHFTRNLALNRQDPDLYAPYMQFSFLKSRRLPLKDEDYQHFSLERSFGQINVHYCQTGKTHWEAFNDQDEEIFDENIAGLRFYSAEFDIDLGPPWTDQELQSDWWKEKKSQFRNWLVRHHFDPDDPKLALGTLKVGQIDLSQFGSNKHGDMIRLLSRYLNVAKISIIDEEGVLEKRFPYCWSDPKYMMRQYRLTWAPDEITDY